MALVFWSDDVRRRTLDCYRGILDKWKTPHAEHRIPTSQGETFVLSAGDQSKPPIILLPGAMATSAMWLRTMDVLSLNHYALAVDVIGDAGFSAASRPRMNSDAHARWLDEVLAGLSLTSAAFLGASLGGWLALDYAIRRNSRVKRLILLAPGGIGRIRTKFLLRTAPLLYLGPWGHRRAMKVDMGFAAEDLRAENQDFLRLFGLVQSGFFARMQPLPTFSDADLRSLDMPVLAVLAGKDAVFDPEETRLRLNRCVPSAQVLLLNDAGHGLRDMTPEISDELNAGRK